jgi:hypothetical protein
LLLCGAWHFPPAVLDVLAPHVRDFAGTLAGEQDHLQRGSVNRIV